MKTYLSDNIRPAAPGTSDAILRVVKQLPWTKLKLDQVERDRERPKPPKTAAQIGSEPRCHCAEGHHLPVWHCPVHGEVVVSMD